MPSQKGQQIVTRIQKLHLELENQFDSKIPEILDQFAAKTSAIIINANLPTDPKQRAKAIKDLQIIKRDIVEAIATLPVYVEAVSDLVKGMEKLKVLSDDYFSELIDGYSNKPALYKEILKSNIETVESKMLGAGVRDNFGEAIKDVLRANIAGESSRTQLNKAVRNAIIGTPEEKSFLNRYIKQVSNDSIQIFNAEYFETVSTDLNIGYYYYQGTLIEDSRPFCKARAGRYFTRAEVQAWADLGHWSGRMPGTTRQTIFSFRGGYSCRHLILPVTEAEYKLKKGQGRAGIK